MADRRSSGQHRLASAAGKKKKKTTLEKISQVHRRGHETVKLKWKCDETISMVLIKFKPSCVQVVNTLPRTEKKKVAAVNCVCGCFPGRRSGTGNLPSASFKP